MTGGKPDWREEGFCTDSETPQPAGLMVADWFRDNPQMTSFDMLTALAHMKAQRDELLGLVKDALETETEFDTDWDKAARAILAKAEGRTDG